MRCAEGEYWFYVVHERVQVALHYVVLGEQKNGARDDHSDWEAGGRRVSVTSPALGIDRVF